MLDTRTLFAVVVGAYSMLGCMLLVLWRLQRGYPALGYWGVSNAISAVGALLIALRGMVPDMLSIAGGNCALLLGEFLMWCGLRQFAGQRFKLRWGWLPVLVPAALYLFFAPLRSGRAARVCFSCAVNAVYAAVCLRDAREAQRQQFLGMRVAAMIAFAGVYLLVVARYVEVAPQLLAGNDATDYLSPQAGQALNTLGLTLLGMLWNLSVIMMFGEHLQQRLVDDARRDGLTGVLNRAGFQQLAARQILRSQRDAQPLAVLLMDLDHFKRINDQYGHAAGDAVIRLIAGTAGSLLRPGDLLGRYGGEEFCVLLPGADLADAAPIAGRIRGEFESRRADSKHGPVGTTVSIGVAAVAATDTSVDMPLARADGALYRAKEKGRNRVECEPASTLPLPLPDSPAPA